MARKFGFSKNTLMQPASALRGGSSDWRDFVPEMPTDSSTGEPKTDWGSLGMMGGMGLAALGGPVAPLILAALYKNYQDGKGEKKAKAQQAELASDYLTAVPPKTFQFQPEEMDQTQNPGLRYASQVTVPGISGANIVGDPEQFDAEQRDRFVRLAPESAARMERDRLYPQKTPLDKRYTNVPGVGLVDLEGVNGPSAVIKEPEKAAPVEMVNAYDLKLKRPLGAVNKVALDKLINEQPGRYQIVGNEAPGAGERGLGERYQSQFGGAIAPNMQPEVGRDGQLTGRLVPIPGGAEDPSVIEKKSKEKLIAEAPGAKAALGTTTQFYDNVIAQIDKIIADPNTDDVVGASEGSGEPIGILSPDNMNALTNIETLQDMLQVQGLQMMRDASKTGGAVGSVTEREWPKLSSRFGNVNRRQKEGPFRDQMANIKNEMTASKQRIQNAYDTTYGAPGVAAPGGGAPSQPQGAPKIVIQNGWRYTADGKPIGPVGQ